MSTQIQPQLFDYEALDTESRIVIQQRAGEIKTLAKRVAGDIVEIGGKLAEVKDRLGGNGKFNAWLTAELGWSERTAYNFIAVHERFGSANFAIENVAPSALYLLVAPGTPEPARQAAVEMANQGEKVTHKTARVLVETAKEAEPKTAAMFDESPVLPDSDVAFCLCEHRADEHDLSAGCKKCVCETFEEMSAEEYSKAQQVKSDLKTVLTPDKQEEPAKPEVKPVTLKPTGKSLDSALWSQRQIVIGITLMPGDGDPRGRQAIVSIRADDGPPTIQSKRLLDMPGEWPRPIDEMIEAFAFKLASEGKPKPQPKKPAKKGAKK